GLFHGCNAIILVNLTLLLNAMTADYYPRISRVIDDRPAASRILNEQFHVMLILAGPALIGISVGASFLLNLLYSSDFESAALLLRFFVVGGIVRIACWTLGFALLAHGRGVAYFVGEAAGMSFAVATWALVPAFGLSGAGPAAVIGASATCIVYAV